jgi:DNA-binding transcriptional MerR regulator
MCCDFGKVNLTQVSPVQRTGGRRYYRLDDMLLLGGIKFLLHEQGMTIKAVQNLLKEQGVAHVQSFSPPILSASKQKDPPTTRPANQKTLHQHKMWWIYSLIRSN